MPSKKRPPKERKSQSPKSEGVHEVIPPIISCDVIEVPHSIARHCAKLVLNTAPTLQWDTQQIRDHADAIDFFKAMVKK